MTKVWLLFTLFSLALVLYLKNKSPKPVWMVYDLPATTGAVREAGYIVIPYPGACRPGQYVLDMYALGVRRLPASSPSATKVRQALHRYMLGEGKLGGGLWALDGFSFSWGWGWLWPVRLWGRGS